MRECYICEQEKEEIEFYTDGKYKNGKPKLSRRCKKCDSERPKSKEYKQRKNSSKWKLERKRENREWLVILKSKLSCSDCGISFNGRPYLCDFHHLDPKQKEFGVGTSMLRSKEKIQEEIDKCLPLCSNCHRIRHYEGRVTTPPILKII